MAEGLGIATYPQEQGLGLKERKTGFKWFLASVLFARSARRKKNGKG
jgi:hypothetical protein